MVFNPQFHLTPHVVKVLEEIASLKTRIEDSSIRVFWVPVLSKDAKVREAQASTAIEGNPLTLEEVRILADGKTLPHAHPRHVQEILNYFAALKFIENHADAKKIKEGDVLRLHEILGKGNALDRGPFGEYRNYGVRVGSHVPPPANEVGPLMKDLLKWLHGPGQAWSPVISSAILHYQFEYIHPFGDGNGRVGRALAHWELYRKKFDTHHIFAVDEIFWEDRPRYYAALQNVQLNEGDLSGWIEFVAEAVAMALERTWKRIEFLKITERKPELILTPKQEKIIVLLREKPMGIGDIQKVLNVTRAGAHHILKPLLKKKIIIRRGGHKTGKYFVK